MSNQGNIRVRGIHEDDSDFLFTTTRWGGGSTPQIVQKCLTPGRPEWEVTESDFLYELCNLPNGHYGLRPIRRLGNTDTPTVLVDFGTQTVSWFADWKNEEVGRWSFSDYLAMSLDGTMNDLWERWYGG